MRGLVATPGAVGAGVNGKFWLNYRTLHEPLLVFTSLTVAFVNKRFYEIRLNYHV